MGRQTKGGAREITDGARVLGWSERAPMHM